MAGWLKLSMFLMFLTLELDAKKVERKLKLVIDEFFVKHHAPNIFEELNCMVTQTNRSYLSCNMILRRSIDKADMVTNFDIIKADNQTRRLFNSRLNFCEYFKTLHKVRIYRAFAKSFETKLGAMINCPLKANFNYTLTNWYMDESQFPSYLPECKFRVSTKFYSYSKLIVTTLNLGSVVYNNYSLL